MQLTKTQCWDVIRQLVSNKNKEYASFLMQTVGKQELPLCIGYTKSLYLNKFGHDTDSEFKYLLKRRGVKPQKEWLDNLSAEDLLLFLDFRCRTLQKMYDFYLVHKSITVDNIRDLILGTKRTSLINYNAGRLKATGRPSAEESEQDIDINDKDMIEQALSQIMYNISKRHAQMVCVSVEDALKKATNLTTTNININGELTGHKFVSGEQLIGFAKQENVKQIPIITADSIQILGFDEKMHPVFKKGNNYVNAFSEILHDVNIVYDLDRKPIEQDKSHVSFVGFDIDGRPIYEDEEGYYNSIGERLDDDVYICNEDEIFTR